MALYCPEVLADALKDPLPGPLPPMLLRNATSKDFKWYRPFGFRDAQNQTSQDDRVTNVKEPSRVQSQSAQPMRLPKGYIPLAPARRFSESTRRERIPLIRLRTARRVFNE